MMKRFFAALVALCLLLGSALAEEATSASPIATYTLPRGAEALHLWDSGVWEIPEGLEEMYRLMQTADMYGDVYLVRMPHGRAMVSVSCMKPDHLRTAQELQALWPQIAQNIAREGVSVNADASCAAVEERFGFEALRIRTTIGLGEPGTGMQLDAEGIAFMRGDELLEVWAVAPEEGSYAAGEPAAQELAADRADMAAFMQSLSFTNLESMAAEGVPYTDPDGRFALVLPAGCTVITRQSAQEEIDRARQAYVDAHGDGAEAFFNEYMSDVVTQHVTLVISEDQQLAAEIFASQEESFRDITADQLAMLAQPIQQSLAEKFDAALLLTADQTVISGSRHAWLGYWLREEALNVQLDVMAAVLEDAWLYEVDLFTHGNDQDQRSLWYMFVSQTMQYTPLSNALGE